MLQKLVNDFTGMGFKSEVKDLNFFQDEYGMEVGDGDETSGSDQGTEYGIVGDEGSEDGSTH